MDTTQICSNCHSVNPISNVYCQVCGASLPSPFPAKPPAPPVITSGAAVSLPPAVPAPIPPAPPTPPAAPYPPVAYQPPIPSIASLGIKVDEFSDIMIDDASRAEEVNEVFQKALLARKIPQMNLSQSDFLGEGKRHRYHVITGPAKTTFLASIAPFGKDLILSWEMYIKRNLKWVPLAIMGGVVVIFPLFSALFSSLSYGGPITFSSYWTNFFQFLFYTALAGLLIGKVLKDDWMYLFVEDIDEISWSEAVALQLVVHEALLETMETILVEPQKPVVKPTVKSTVRGSAKKTTKLIAKPKPSDRKK